MKEANNIEELFKSKLQDLETPVRADLWNNIAVQSGIQTSFWSASKIAGLSASLVVISAALWFGLSSPEKQSVKQEPAVELVENAVEEDLMVETNHNSEQQESIVEVNLDEKEAPNNILVQNPKSFKSPISLPEPVTMTMDEWNNYLRDRDASFGEKGSTSTVKESSSVVDIKVESLPLKESVSEKLAANGTDKVDTKAFEPVERLDLEVLIAAEKREEVSREALHYPTAFPKIFNPNVSGDAASFSIDVRDVSYFKVEIKNKKGQLVFQSQDPDFIWKGATLDGSMAPEGTYLFLIESNDLNGEALKPQSGAVFLMR